MGDDPVTEKISASYYVVVHVMAGIPVSAELYANEDYALMREQYFREHMHSENDETGIFQTFLRYDIAADAQ
jgi:hypothetical protein